jgi:hypothetical protein
MSIPTADVRQAIDAHTRSRADAESSSRRVGQLELDRLAAFRILNAGEQGRFEQFRFLFELLHLPLFNALSATMRARQPSRGVRMSRIDPFETVANGGFPASQQRGCCIFASNLLVQISRPLC